MLYTGSVESKDVIVTAQVNGEITDDYVFEGESVAQDQLLMSIDNQSLQYDLRALEINKEIAELTLSDLLDGVQDTSIVLKESEINVINEEILAQKRLVEYNKEQFEKNKILYNTQAISKEQLDASELTYLQSLDKLDILYQKRTVAINSKETVENSSTEQVIKKASKNIESIKNQMDKLKYELDKSSIEAPMDGIIQKKYKNAREFATRGEPLFKIIDPVDMHLVVYVPEKHLSKIHINKEVKFIDDFVGEDTYGSISFISEKAEFTPKNVATRESKQELVFQTKIKIHNSSLIKPGMYLTVDLLGD
jgi:HlyD family secretion protein